MLAMTSRKALAAIELLESRIAPAGVVDIIVSGGALTLKTLAAGDGDESLAITPGAGAGEYVIDPDPGTKVRFNGTELADGAPQNVAGVTKGMTIALGIGADKLTMSDLIVSGAVKIDLGAGANSFTAVGSVFGPLSYKAGDGADTINLTNSAIGGGAKLEPGTGGSTFNLTGLVVAGDLAIKGSTDNDTINSNVGDATRVGGKFTASLGAGANAIGLLGPLFVGKDAIFTSGDGNDNLGLNGGGDYIIGGSLVMKTGKGNDSAGGSIGGVLQVGKDFTLASGGAVNATDDVTQSFRSSFRDTIVGGSVTFKAVGDDLTQTLTAVRVLTVGGGVSFSAKGTSSAAQTLTAAVDGVSNSSIKGAVSLTGGDSVICAVPGDLRSSLTITPDALDNSLDVDIGSAAGGYSGRVLGAVKVSLPSAAGSTRTLDLRGTTFASSVTVAGGAGNDTFTVFESVLVGALKFDGAAGNDTANLENGTAQAAGTLLLGPVTLKGGAGTDTFTLGGAGANDPLFATALVSIDGGADADTLTIDPTAVLLLPVKQANIP